MDSKAITFDLNDLSDVKNIHRMLFDDDSTKGDDFEDQSDTNSGDELQVRGQDSETQQSDIDSSSEGENSENDTHCIACRTKNGKIVNSYRWNKCPPSNGKKTSKQNLPVHLPGVIGDAMKF